MSSVFSIEPSKWEVDHAAGIVSGQAYESQHGVLPDTPMWRMLERRFELNPVRFSFWHPNVAILIEHQGLSPIEHPQPHGWIGRMRGPSPPITPPTCDLPGVACPPRAPHMGGQTVPEPASSMLLAIALMAWGAWYFGTQDRSK